MLPSADTLARLIEETASEEILPRFRKLAGDEVDRKAGGELVTIADTVAEARLAARLTEILPGSVVVGEESAAADPRLIKQLDGTDPVWLIDPVDGTGNFAAGIPLFVVMVALVRAGEILLSAIHQPTLQRTALAEKGGGAWMSGRRLHVAPAAALADLRGTLHAGHFGTPRLKARVRELRRETGAGPRVLPSLSCAGAEYVRLSLGEAHFCLFTRLKPWDHAPGVLLHSEAGGHPRTLEGSTYDPGRDVAEGLLMAQDEATWTAVRDWLLNAGQELPPGATPSPSGA